MRISNPKLVGEDSYGSKYEGPEALNPGYLAQGELYLEAYLSRFLDKIGVIARTRLSAESSSWFDWLLVPIVILASSVVVYHRRGVPLSRKFETIAPDRLSIYSSEG